MAIQENPYLPPQARVADAVLEVGNYIDGGRAVPAGHGWDWVSTGWGIFRRQAGMWVLLTLVFALIMIVLGVIPIVSLAVSLLMPVFIGGFMLACAKIEQGDEIELADLFSGFKNNGGALVLVGLIGLGLIFALTIPMVAVFFMAFAGVGGDSMPALDSTLLIAMLVFTALVIPIYMALWFAPALVVFHDHKPGHAIAQSFRGCLKNFVPFLVYGVAWFVLAILATIPLMLGWFVVGPVLLASVYAAYRDIFFER